MVEDCYFMFVYNLQILKVKSDCNIEFVCVEVNLRKRKWFINGSYNPNKSFISNHLECLHRIIHEYSKIYQNVLFWRDFNVSISEKCLAEFYNLNGLTLRCLINEVGETGRGGRGGGGRLLIFRFFSDRPEAY